jgi:hypothetical protein
MMQSWQDGTSLLAKTTAPQRASGAKQTLFQWINKEKVVFDV